MIEPPETQVFEPFVVGVLNHDLLDTVRGNVPADGVAPLLADDDWANVPLAVLRSPAELYRTLSELEVGRVADDGAVLHPVSSVTAKLLVPDARTALAWLLLREDRNCERNG